MLIDGHEIILPKGDDEQYEEPGSRGGPVEDQKTLDLEERRDDAQLEHQAMELCRKVEVNHHRAKSRRKVANPRDAPF
jgi:hypothetical protein